MIAAAKLIASQGEKLVKFARILAKYCKDKRFVYYNMTTVFIRIEATGAKTKYGGVPFFKGPICWWCCCT